MVGRRWDVDITRPIDFAEPNWAERLRKFARQKGEQQPGWSVDYFAFLRGLYREMAGLVVGRVWWDHWLIWKARQARADVVDASEVVTAIHQNHNYGYHPAGAAGCGTTSRRGETTSWQAARGICSPWMTRHTFWERADRGGTTGASGRRHGGG
jgi:hypothetical protein